MRTNYRTRLSTLVIACLFSAALLLMIQHPSVVMSAAARGVSIWWDVLFPSLLPFFIISEALLGFGIVHFIGTLLDPVMRPLFRVPGVGGFVVAMGYASGYPVGARLTTRLRMQGLISREEGERLVAFTTTSDPIFLIGAVSVGFFGDAGLAVTLALAHYCSGLLVGVLMRFHAYRSPLTQQQESNDHEPKATHSRQRKWSNSILLRAFYAMHEARQQDGRPLGTLLKEAIESSLKLMVVVGGLVVFFSVLLELLATVGIMNVWNVLLQAVLGALHLPATLAASFSGGLFEVTLGAKEAGAAATAGVHAQVVAAAWILSWAGLSVHAQVASIMNQTDLRYTPFLVARLLHSMIAAVAAYFIYPLAQLWQPQLAAWLPNSGLTVTEYSVWTMAQQALLTGLWWSLILLAILLTVSLLIHLIRQVRVLFFTKK
ncbi:sporulation integral membrane protein YlbJ [Paenibacillus sp. 481]|uniref:sporulation integral membrane protein YlbJ n=1 Tax=Paenibacillus sp. 481 TaxID=2835869 RepID=UPI001E42F397|nr:sporulation integral membrane protein YlbJ [Paenibacillus sp. 481]UHA74656.1 sporulation integral membrane protein YlbJ [Paenibacillus sp. 481]